MAVITAIEAIPLRIPLKSDLPGAALWGESLTAADSLLVKVSTDDGVSGWGEAFGLRGTGLAAHALDELVAPLCLGRDAADIASLTEHVQQAGKSVVSGARVGMMGVRRAAVMRGG